MHTPDFGGFPRSQTHNLMTRDQPDSILSPKKYDIFDPNLSNGQLKNRLIFPKSDRFTWKNVTIPIRTTVSLIWRINSLRYKPTFLVYSTDFNLTSSENRARTGLVWLIQAVKAQLTILYYVINIFPSLALTPKKITKFKKKICF